MMPAGRAICVLPPAPATHTDHLVVRGPVRERVIRRMIADKSTAAAYIFFESDLCGVRPGQAIVVGDNHTEGAEIRLETTHVRSGRRGRHRGHEQTGVFQNPLQNRRGLLPMMIVLPVNDESFQLTGGANLRDGKEEQTGERGEGCASHLSSMSYFRNTHLPPAGVAATSDTDSITRREQKRPKCPNPPPYGQWLSPSEHPTT